MAAASKILILTDLHITVPGDTIIGLDPSARLEQVLQAALARHQDADHLIFTGDLTHHGTINEYRQLRQIVGKLPIPVTWMLGNHDDRAAFRCVFPEADVDASGFVQRVIDLPPARLITLDTLDKTAQPHHSGTLCEARLNWLEAQAVAAQGKPLVILMHHTPFMTGFDGMDAIGLTNRSEVVSRLQALPNVALIVAGHIHRTIMGTVGRIPAITFKGTCHQMPMLLGQPGSGHSIDEPGAYGILLIQESGEIVAHTDDVFTRCTAIDSDPSSQ